MTRTVADACPGVLRPHRAADGALVRLRLAGGVTSAASLSALASAAGRFADGTIQLTSRGNLQLRGLSVTAGGEVDPKLTAAVTAAGFLPSASHERVRNILASPLTGRRGGLADLRAVTAELDRSLQRTPVLADLPGRFLFALDDGSGDVGALRADLGFRATGPETGRVVVGDLLGPEIPLADLPRQLIALATRFVQSADGRWQVRELPLGGRELAEGLAEADAAVSRETPLGVLDQANGRRLCSVAVPFGSMTAAQVTAIAEVAALGSGEVIVTPWRGVVVPDLPADVGDAAALALRAAGLILDEDSPWAGITACTGSPGCAKGKADVRALTWAAVTRIGVVDTSANRLPVHVVACERRCGSPAGRHLEVLADTDGLIVTVAEEHRRVDTIDAALAYRSSHPARGNDAENFSEHLQQ